MSRILQRDQSAFASLYDRYGALVFSLARHVLQDNGMAEEVVQDVFLKVWQQAFTWDEERGKLVSWLLTMTRYTAIDRLRKEQRRPLRNSSSIESLYDLLPDSDSPDETLHLDSTALRDMMATLPNEQQQMLQLAFFQGMSHSEIADKTNIPLGTVKTRLRLGMQRLRHMWQMERPTDDENS
ncbi:MAG: sigma-70 family RNA polymerase sigma factor [Anaerolineae bacterium]|nr:sigma-70 family RNA polymerase sigma factor [Anaerolineae bacterium]MCA9907438.1 sigma-70 family RNA polymerase sigma factor [Anaerolineae bacterium]